MIKNFIKQKWMYLLLIGVGVFLLIIALSQLSGQVLTIVSIAAAAIIAMGFINTAKKDVVEGALSKDKLERMQQDFEQLKYEHHKVLAENKTLHDMKVNVSNIKPLVEIGLFEAETAFTQFIDQYFDENNREINDPGLIELIKKQPNVYAERYADTPSRIIGSLHFNIDAIYGIKVEEIMVRLLAENGLPKVEVFGAKPKFLSFKSRSESWKNTVALRYSSPLIGKESWKTDPKLLELSSLFLESKKEKLLKETEKGPKELDWIKKPLENQIKSMLEMLFFKGYIIEFVEETTDDFISLNEFANSKLIQEPDSKLLTEYAEEAKN